MNPLEQLWKRYLILMKMKRLSNQQFQRALIHWKTCSAIELSKVSVSEHVWNQYCQKTNLEKPKSFTKVSLRRTAFKIYIFLILVASQNCRQLNLVFKAKEVRKFRWGYFLCEHNWKGLPWLACSCFWFGNTIFIPFKSFQSWIPKSFRFKARIHIFSRLPK